MHRGIDPELKCRQVSTGTRLRSKSTLRLHFIGHLDTFYRLIYENRNLKLQTKEAICTYICLLTYLYWPYMWPK